TDKEKSEYRNRKRRDNYHKFKSKYNPWASSSAIARDKMHESIDTYLDSFPGLDRMNMVFDQLSLRLYTNTQTFVDAVRAVLDFHGLKLPHLPCEHETLGPNLGAA